MSNFSYPVLLEPDDNGTMLLTFPDVPEAITFGEDRDDALAQAIDALEAALTGYIQDRRDIPAPSPARGAATVSPGLLATLKLGLYQAMRARNWRKADLARALATNPRQVDRLLDLRHASTVAQIEQAAAVVGKTFVIDVADRTMELETA